MISVQDALAHIRSVRPVPASESVLVTEAMQRVLSEHLIALVNMPPFSAANMDGYAVSDCQTGDRLTVIGESAAGHPFDGHISAGEAVRISTGAMMPNGADRVLIQEHAERAGNEIIVNIMPPAGKHIRPAASDFAAGARLLSSQHRLNPADLTLAAAAGQAKINVHCKLKIAKFSSGDELQPIEQDLATGQIYAANGVGLSPLLEQWGASVTDFGIIPDSSEALSSLLPKLAEYDIILPIGGASVGDHDHMRPGFRKAGFEILFETVAVRPGKPSWMGKKSNQIVFGLPGNPASAFVCAHLFLRPLLGLGITALPAVLNEPIEENGPRETYLRGRAVIQDGSLRVTAEDAQESFRLRPQSKANALIKVPPMGGPHMAGDQLDIILIGELDATG